MPTKAQLESQIGDLQQRLSLSDERTAKLARLLADREDQIKRLETRIEQLSENDTEETTTPPDSPPRDTQPPPPPPGVPPPPPPMHRTVSEIAGYRPTVKMRSLFWTRYRGADKTKRLTVWDRVMGGKTWTLSKSFRQDFERLFRLPQRKTKVARKTDPGNRPITVLDAKKSTMVGIVMSSLPADLEPAISDGTLSLENVTNLLKSLPESQDLSDIEIQRSANPNRPLRDAEAFLVKLASIDHVEEKLNCLRFRLSFDETWRDMYDRILLVRSAVMQLRLCNDLPRILTLYLQAGNFMNHGTARGDATGFSYDSLPKFLDCKGNDRRTTLHDFCSAYLTKGRIAVEDLPEVGLLRKASTLSMVELKSMLDQIVDDFQTCQRMASFLQEREEVDVAVSFFFHGYAKALVETLQQTMDLCQGEFHDLLSWLGEPLANASKVQSDEFFEVWVQFLEGFVSQ